MTYALARLLKAVATEYVALQKRRVARGSAAGLFKKA
jgi:hypothetical protein